MDCTGPMRTMIGSDDGSLPGVGAAASPWIGGDETVFQFIEDFGEITAGTRLAFPHAGRVSGEPNGRSYLPVDAAGAEIVAIDGQGRPALLRNPVGSGCAVLCTYPLEYLAARTPRANPESTWRIYSALAPISGVSRPVRVDDPRVSAGLLRGGVDDTALIVNCSPEAISVEPILEDDIELQQAEGELTLGPFGVAAIACRSAVRRDRATERDLVLQATSTVGRAEGRDARA